MELDLNDLNYNSASYWDVKRLGGIKVHQGRGVFWAYSENMVSLDKLIVIPETLNSVGYVADAPVIFEQKTVGTIDEIVHVRLDGSLLIFFKLLSKTSLVIPTEDLKKMNELIINQEECIAVPQIETKQLQCVSCGIIYDKGQTPCGCIERCDNVIPLKVQINGIDIYNVKNSNVEPNNKSVLMKTFFGGAMGSIVFSDPI